MRFQTISVKGKEREANHDYADGVFDGTRGLFVITDGTMKLGSSQLAQGFVQGVISTYQSLIKQGAEDSSQDLVEQLLKVVLTALHSQLFCELTGTTSYLVGVVSQGQLTVAYEGDCSCGLAGSDGKVDWFTPPHCKANWKRDRSHRELAHDPTRNLVTRSLRANRTPDPEFVHRSAPVGARFIFATDGFWAELNEAQQAAALETPSGGIVNAGDDVTWIDVTL